MRPPVGGLQRALLRRLAIVAAIGYGLLLPTVILFTGLLYEESFALPELSESLICGFVYLVWLPGVILPLCVAGERLLVRRLRLPAWLHIPIMGAVFAGCILAPIGLPVLAVTAGIHSPLDSEISAVALLAAQSLLWGLGCWVLFRILDRFWGQD